MRVGDWVKLKGVSPGKGLLTDLGRNTAQVRWIGSAKAQKVNRASLMTKDVFPPRPLLLEGSLDAHVHSRRSERPAIESWCETNGLALAYKNVHAPTDIRLIWNALEEKPLFVHISCHGRNDGKGMPELEFTCGHPLSLDRQDLQQAFRHFRGLPVLLSACEVGRFEAEVEHFRQKTGIAFLAAFTRDIHDDEALLFDLAVYHLVYEQGVNFRTAVDRASNFLLRLGIAGRKGKNGGLARVFPLG